MGDVLRIIFTGHMCQNIELREVQAKAPSECACYLTTFRLTLKAGMCTTKNMALGLYFGGLKLKFHPKSQNIQDDRKQGIPRKYEYFSKYSRISDFFFTSQIPKDLLYMSVKRFRYIHGFASKRVKMKMAPRVSILFARHCMSRASPQ